MANNNSSFHGKPILDGYVRRFMESVYGYYDFLRVAGYPPAFGKYYYPAMVASCCDSKEKHYAHSISDMPYVSEYGRTPLLRAMEKAFYGGTPIKDFRLMPRKYGLNYSVGQCAEQHAANDLLFVHNIMEHKYPDIKRDIYFSDAIRPATGEVFPYCPICKKLFQL